MEIVDQDGRSVVTNKYETNPYSPNFDRIVSHRQGQLQAHLVSAHAPTINALHSLGGSLTPVALPPADPDLGQTMTFEYHDLRAEQNGIGQPNPSYVASLYQFQSVDICPKKCVSSHVESGAGCNSGTTICDQYGNDYDPVSRWSGPMPFQQVAYAVVIHDYDSIVRTNYFDVNWQLLRSVNHAAGTVIDLNYDENSLLIGTESETGERTCVTSNAQGNPLRATELPAPGRSGDTASHATLFAYDAGGQLIQALREPDSASPAGRRILRDSLERVIAIGDQVDANNARWTCFDYADPITGGEPFPAASTGSIGTTVTRLIGGVLSMLRWPWQGPALFQQSGCAINLRQGQAAAAGARRRDVEPSAITFPDGTITNQSGLTSLWSELGHCRRNGRRAATAVSARGRVSVDRARVRERVCRTIFRIGKFG